MGSRAPRIYYLNPLLAGPLAGWDAQLRQIGQLGFDHVLLAPPFATGPSRDLFLPADYDRIDARLGWAGDADAALASLSEACGKAGLKLLLDVVLDQVAADSPAAERLADLFGGFDETAALDPRGAGGNFEAARLRADAPRVAEWWASQLTRWVGAGVGGFRLLPSGALAPSVLASIITSARRQGDALFLGWAPGAPRAALASAGFDFLFGSLPWWDYRAEWFWTELAELSRIAPVIAAPEAPFAARLAMQVHDPALLRPVYERGLAFAAALGAGWMMPMGFEFGASRPMHPATDGPEDFAAMREAAPFDLSERVAALNRTRASEPAFGTTDAPALLAGAGSDCVAVLRGGRRSSARPMLVIANADPARRHALPAATLIGAAGGTFARFEPVLPPDSPSLGPGEAAMLEAGEVLLYRGVRSEPRPMQRPPLQQTAAEACEAPRIAIEQVAPSVENGLFPVKRVVGETFVVEADVIVDGHDVLGVALMWRDARESAWRQVSMRPLGNDRWQASFPLAEIGTYLFTIEAWRDAFGTFRDELAKKQAAGVDTRLEVQEGIALLRETAEGAPDLAIDAILQRLVSLDEAGQRAMLLSTEMAGTMARTDPRPFAVRVEPALQVQAERTAARFASWYEIFPRSMSDDPERHGTFADVVRHLPRIRDMGFDVLYFPPISPIGRKNRKGRNNSLTPAPEDPGSPYAIGSPEGGHDALHPELGTLADLQRLREAAEWQGIELAIDFAIQCSPDHPWLRDHKGWFDWRPDGSIRYAENPPKRYEDIVNVDFYAPGAIPDLWVALCDVVLFWAGQGIRLFRVDNPHTKPLPFWHWMIAEVRARYPDAIFLAEAFTRPKVMYRLAKVGFSQSYTYFTWRNTKRELTEYLEELTTTAPREFFRPHFFVNTPDINPVFLQTSGRPGFLIRAALAATLSGLWGVYNGFELCEAQSLPGREEYADSEKYQIRAWDWDRPGNIVPEITRLNRIRQTNPALHTHLNLAFQTIFNDAIIYYRKTTPDRSNTVLIAVSLDPHGVQEADFVVPLWEWGLPDTAAVEVDDLVSGTTTVWQGTRQHLRLEPSMPYAIWRVRPFA